MKIVIYIGSINADVMPTLISLKIKSVSLHPFLNSGTAEFIGVIGAAN